MNLHLCQKDYMQLRIDENPLICVCHHRSLQDVLNFLPHHTGWGVDELVAMIQQQTGASTGCGSCLAKVQGISECYALKPEIFANKSTGR